MRKITEIFIDDLIGEPVPHILATGKNVFVFNLVINIKTDALKTGHCLDYAGGIYEVMNICRVQSANDYLKLNSVKKNDSLQGNNLIERDINFQW